MKRSSLPRSTKPLKRTRVKPVNAKRRQSEFARVYESTARVAWVKQRVCLVYRSMTCDGPTENAHTVTGGLGRKADSRYIVPLCRKHHRHLHAIGVSAFEKAYTTSLAYGAELTEQAWQEERA